MPLFAQVVLPVIMCKRFFYVCMCLYCIQFMQQVAVINYMSSYYASAWVCVCQNITIMSAWTETPVHVLVIFLSFISLKQLSMDTKKIKRSRYTKSEKQNIHARTNMKKSLHMNTHIYNYYHFTQRGFRGTGLVFCLLKPDNCSNTFSELLSYHRSAHRFPLNRCAEDNIAKRVCGGEAILAATRAPLTRTPARWPISKELASFERSTARWRHLQTASSHWRRAADWFLYNVPGLPCRRQNDWLPICSPHPHPRHHPRGMPWEKQPASHRLVPCLYPLRACVRACVRACERSRTRARLFCRCPLEKMKELRHWPVSTLLSASLPFLPLWWSILTCWKHLTQGPVSPRSSPSEQVWIFNLPCFFISALHFQFIKLFELSFMVILCFRRAHIVYVFFFPSFTCDYQPLPSTEFVEYVTVCLHCASASASTLFLSSVYFVEC